MLDGGEYLGAVGDDGSLEFHERRDATSPRPGDPSVERLAGFLVGKLEDDAQSLLEVVRTSEGGVGLDDPGELGALTLGQVLRVLPEGVARVLERDGASAVGTRGRVSDGPASAAPAFVAPGGRAYVVPGTSSHLVQGVGGPAALRERVRRSAAHSRSARRRRD